MTLLHGFLNCSRYSEHESIHGFDPSEKKTYLRISRTQLNDHLEMDIPNDQCQFYLALSFEPEIYLA